ncbi:multidrug and toxin extrusion 1-like protein [Labeo rohita]|uniref:Multidrug and toxin extrusion 1-like protein n=1 Tax=Labeo rohita TaxID=84645 RepID=A0A498M3N9_LABRO|nr:multidrug and toxin extrusion 1-like protein [Labeo rohita]
MRKPPRGLRPRCDFFRVAIPPLPPNTVNVTTTATGCGLALTCDTLVSQTFGSKNLKRVGEILQRSILILLLFCLPCWAILMNAESILLTLKQEPEVARIAQLYVMAFLPAVPAMFLHQLQVSYLQNQGIILPQMYTAVAANILNIATNYILLYSMKLGVMGSAAANSISQISICLLLFAYIRWKKLHVKTWGGWSTAALQEWGSYMKLAIPSTLMLCFEWWIYEIGGFLAGLWLGLFICVIIQSCFFTTLIFKLNWKKVTEQAQKRAGKHAKVVCVQKAPSIGQSVLDTLVSEGQDSNVQTPDIGASASSANK